MGGIHTILLTHRDDVADAEKYAEKFGAEVVIHAADATAAPFASRTLEGVEPIEVAPGVVAIPLPGHTEGSVAYLVDETWLFTGDSMAWSHSDECFYAFADACWFSWETQIESLSRLGAEHRFEQIFAGHGGSSPRLPPERTRELVEQLVERMPFQG